MTEYLQEFKKYKLVFTYYLLIVSVYFGTVFYDVLCKFGFSYIDEILAFGLLSVTLLIGKISREFIVFGLISIFYLFYSLFWGANVGKAVFVDYIIQVKPFIAFYSVSCLSLGLNDFYKKRLSIHIKCIFFVYLVGTPMAYDFFVYSLPGHPSRYATTMVILGFLYYYCSERKNRDVILSLLIWALGMASTRSKSYAFVAISVLMLLVFKDRRYYKLSFRNMIPVLLVFAAAMCVAWGKFSYYFIEGSASRDFEDMMARPALYVGAAMILLDNPLLGTGLGSYATYASSVYYSPVYYKYDLNAIYGLVEDSGEFICDTFLPEMAQFGIVGILLFSWFFWIRFHRIRILYRKNPDLRWLQYCLLIFVFFAIESTVDSTFVHNRGMVMMVILALFLNEGKRKNICSATYRTTGPERV